MFDNAKWIWNSDSKGTDCYTEFITSYEFQEHDTVRLRLSADSNYAVYVNGCFANSGQYGDYPFYKVYDEIDLSGFIKTGINHIAFIVWYYGVSSFNYYVGTPGLLFEIERNGDVVRSSNEFILSRNSKGYISGKNEMITAQLGLNFHVNLKKSNKWMTGESKTGFGVSQIVDDMPRELVPRPIEKLCVNPRVDTKIVQRGTFTYREGENHFGAKMQYANLTSYKYWEIGQDTLVSPTGEDIYFIVDLQKETSGYLDFELEVPDDCSMEVGWGEHLEDGRCRTSIGPRNFSVTVELQKGLNTYMNPFRRLGCRYLQFFIHTKEVKIHYAGLRPTTYPVKRKVFKSGNLLRDKIYGVSQDTLLHCMHEHYEDCPWREQSLYTMDTRNQMLCGYYAFSEYEFAKATLKLIAKSVRDDGALPICFPTRERLSIPSFTLAYVIQLSEYYEYTKDKETVEECFGTVKKIVESFLARIGEKGLLPNFDEEQKFWNFYEWQEGLEGYTYKGEAYDLCLNTLFSFVMDHFRKLCDVMEICEEEYSAAKQQLNRCIVEAFYDEKTRLFRTCIGHDVDYSVLGNAWAYLCGAGESVKCEEIIKILEANGSVESHINVIPATLSMNAFRYDALLKADREQYGKFILEEIDETYLYMLRNGATTFWETIKGEADFAHAGSLCHGWSAMPIYYYEILSEYLNSK